MIWVLDYLLLKSMGTELYEFKSGGLYEKHEVASWNFGNHLGICWKTEEKPRNPVSRWALRRTFGCILTSSKHSDNHKRKSPTASLKCAVALFVILTMSLT
jgi:hypothetical protein